MRADACAWMGRTGPTSRRADVGALDAQRVLGLDVAAVEYAPASEASREPGAIGETEREEGQKQQSGRAKEAKAHLTGWSVASGPSPHLFVRRVVGRDCVDAAGFRVGTLRWSARPDPQLSLVGWEVRGCSGGEPTGGGRTRRDSSGSDALQPRVLPDSAWLRCVRGLMRTRPVEGTRSGSCAVFIRGGSSTGATRHRCDDMRPAPLLERDAGAMRSGAPAGVQGCPRFEQSRRRSKIRCIRT